MNVRKPSENDDPVAPTEEDDSPRGPQGAGVFGLLDIPEPVAGADYDLSRSITPDEFRRAASDRFQLLDTTHSGRLTLAQLQAMRPGGHSGSYSGHGGHGGHRHGGGESGGYRSNSGGSIQP